MFEGSFSPPVYHDLYNFKDGAQTDIFLDSYVSLPPPAPNASLPVLADLSATNSTSTANPSIMSSSNSNPLTTSSTPNSNSNSTSTSGKICKQKKTASSSPLPPSTSTRSMRRFYQSNSMMAMSRRSRRLSVHKREMLWNMW